MKTKFPLMLLLVTSLTTQAQWTGTSATSATDNATRLGKTGIGISSTPASELHLKAIGSGNTWADMIFESTAGKQWSLSGRDDRFVLINWTNATTSSDYLTILNGNGDVGIGTISPISDLDVRGGGKITCDAIYFYGGTAGIGTDNLPNVRIEDVFGMRFRANSDGHYVFSSQTSVLAGYLPDGTTNYGTGNIMASGKIGIGTVAPGVNLDINGGSANSAISLLSGSATANSQFILGRATADGRLGIASSAGNYSTDAAIGDFVIRSEGSGKKLLFNTNGGTGVATMAISGNNVGIGITSPAANLHVSGTNNTLLKLQYSPGGIGQTTQIDFATYSSANNPVNARIGAIDRGGFNGALVFSTDGDGIDNSNVVERMRISETGNVGIGTSTPAANLHVAVSTGSNNATMMIEATNSGQAGLTLKAGQGSTNRSGRIDFLNSVSSATLPQWSLINDYTQTGTNDFTIVDNTSRKLTILQGGNVGIGTSTPTAQLEVAQSGTAIFRNTNFSTNGFIGGAVNIFRLNADNSGSTVNTVLNLGNYYNGNACNSNVLAIDFRNGDGGGIYGGNTPNGRIKVQTACEASYMRFDLGGNTVMALQTNGNVGIGTTKPANDLHIDPNGTGGITIGKNSDGDPGNGGAGYTALVMNISQAQNGYASINSISQSGSANGNLVLNSNGGNVGIGTTSPSATLEVNGTFKVSGAAMFIDKVHATEFRACLSPGSICPPDYVFEDDYQLRGLEEVQKYIKANKHLPEVPSAHQMLQDGVGMMEMNMILLKKVEEITLYMLQMERTNKEMQKSNQALEKRLIEIEAKTK